MEELHRLDEEQGEASGVNQEMQMFFRNIIEMQYRNPEKDILARDADIMFKTILDSYKQNISIAAAHKQKYAYLFIYETSARINGHIPVHQLLFMDDDLIQKFRNFNIIPVMERVQKYMRPFSITVEAIDSQQFTNDVLRDMHFMAIIATWQVPAPA